MSADPRAWKLLVELRRAGGDVRDGRVRLPGASWAERVREHGAAIRDLAEAEAEWRRALERVGRIVADAGGLEGNRRTERAEDDFRVQLTAGDGARARAAAIRWVNEWECLALAKSGPARLRSETCGDMVILGDRSESAVAEEKRANPSASVWFPHEIAEIEDAPEIRPVAAMVKREFGAWLIPDGSREFGKE